MNKSTSILKIYGDKISQPTRSVLLFCELNNIPYIFIPVILAKNEQIKNKEFLKVNPFGKIPAISFSNSNGKDFNLAESCTILRFLSEVFNVEDKWYPKSDIFRKSLIDQYLDWHHSNTRRVFAGAIYKKMVAPWLIKMGGEEAQKAKLAVDTSNEIPQAFRTF